MIIGVDNMSVAGAKSAEMLETTFEHEILHKCKVQCTMHGVSSLLGTFNCCYLFLFPALLPSAPTITTAVSQSSTSTTLIWTQPEEDFVDRFEIVASYQGDCTGVTYTSTWFLYGTARQHTLTGLKEFSNYTVTMVAVNDAGRTEQSSRSFVTMADGMYLIAIFTRLSCVNCDCLFFFQHSAPDGSPMNVNALAISPVSIIIRWDRVPCINRNSDITGYIVRYSKDGGSTVDVSVSGTGQSDRTYTASWLAPNTSYSIQVAAVNSTGEIGPFSTTVTVKTLPPESKILQFCMVASLHVKVNVPNEVTKNLHIFTYRCFCFEWCCHSKPWFCCFGQYW